MWHNIPFVHSTCKPNKSNNIPLEAHKSTITHYCASKVPYQMEEINNSPLKAIREKCKDCTSNQMNEVKACSVVDCPIWYFRFAKRPLKDGKLRQNPFLDKNNFKGREQLTATQHTQSIITLENGKGTHILEKKK